MLNVFYRSEQCAPQCSFSPSSIKPHLVVQDWLQRHGDSIRIRSFEPVPRSAFKLVHDPVVVDGVLDGRQRNGFGNHSADVAASLPYTTGSLLAAAEYAVLHRTQTCSPTSGFHHASYDRPQGFCTFNGLVVTAVLLKQAGLVHSVGILDCDAHFGNGTQELIERHGLHWLRHHTMGAHFNDRRDVRSLPGGGTTFSRWLQAAIEDVRACDLVIYQAGADPHIDDPLGGILCTDQMRERDCMVFEGLRGKPLAWNLAGGYQTREEADAGGASPLTKAEQLEPVLALHRATLEAHLGVLNSPNANQAHTLSQSDCMFQPKEVCDAA